jgi:hypothetical protein
MTAPTDPGLSLAPISTMAFGLKIASKFLVVTDASAVCLFRAQRAQHHIVATSLWLLIRVKFA